MKYAYIFLILILGAGSGFSQNYDYHPHEIVLKVKWQNLMPNEILLHSVSDATPQRVFPNHQAPSPKEQSRSGQPLVDLSRIYSLRLKAGVSPKEAVKLLKTDKNIEYAEILRVPKPLFVPNDPGAATPSPVASDFNQYYLHKIKAYEAWDVQQGNPSTIIGVIDYGFRISHEDLIGNLHPEYYDAGNNDFTMELPHCFRYHGTAVAGVAAATPNNGVGIAGVGYNSRFLPVKVISDALNIFRFDVSVVYLADRNVKVINMSFGYEGEPDEYWEDIVNYAVINKDVVMVAAAGNNGNTGRFWPASYKNVISVTGSTDSDTRWGGSNFNYEVDVTAPSEFIHTTYYQLPPCFGGVFNTDQSYIPGVTWNFSGTSFASPQVAGAVALLRTQFPELNALQAMARLIATSDNIDALNPSVAGLIGKGRLNVFRAVSETDVKAIRLENYLFRSNAQPFAGNNAELIVDFKNLLTPTSNLQVSLQSLSPLVNVVSANATLGAMNTNETKNNENTPFVLSISPSAAYNTEIVLRFDFQDGTFNSYEYLKIIINPDYLHLDINQLTIHIGKTGKVAEYFYPYRKAIGYNDAAEYKTIAYAGGLILATHPDSVSNSVSDYAGGFVSDFDTVGVNNFTLQKTATYQEINAHFRDTISKRPKLKIQKKAYAFDEAPNQKFAIIEYDITNDSNRVINHLYASLFTDFDLLTYTQNRAAWNASLNLGYAFHSSENLYAGIKLLTQQSPNYYAFNSNGSSGSINLYDGFSKAEKFASTSNGILRASAGTSGLGTDISLAVGGTISNLAPQETRKIAFAYIVGNSLAELENNAQLAQDKFVELNTSEIPAIASNFSVCYDGSVLLAPGNGNTFDFYDTFPLTTPIATGSSLQINNLTANKTIYIVGRDKLYPSPAKVVNVQVAPLHQAVILATPMWGGEWLLQDNSQNWAASQWDFGDGNTATGRSVRHKFANLGNYEVTLISTNLQGCKDTTTQRISVITRLEEIWKQVSVYPNPTENEVFIEGLLSFDWVLKNSLGNVLMRGKEQKIVLKDLPAGFYYLSIVLPSQEQKTCKIVKK
jgi:subtilisin family serine protease/chitodextrinase